MNKSQKGSQRFGFNTSEDDRYIFGLYESQNGRSGLQETLKGRYQLSWNRFSLYESQNGRYRYGMNKSQNGRQRAGLHEREKHRYK